MIRPTCPACEKRPELACDKCAAWWGAELAKLPPVDAPVIKDARHAHTAGMRLRNLSNLIEFDPDLLGALVPAGAHDYVIRELRRAAEEIGS